MSALDNSFDDLPQELLDTVERFERMRRDFVANVSHELRTPLTVIRGYLETLITQDDPKYAELQSVFHQMFQHSMRMDAIIQDLLLLSRLESEQTATGEETVNVGEQLEIICNEAQLLSANDNHVISLHADTDLKLLGSPNELRSLFTNLIINAVRYTPPGGEIDVHWQLENDKPAFSVSDRGIGIPNEHISRLTERFYCVDKARSREKGGTGLGLAIVKHVILRHEGELNITSQVDEGSTFTCTFPASRRA